MNQSQMNLTFGMQKTVTLTDECKRCDYLKLCYGGALNIDFLLGKMESLNILIFVKVIRNFLSTVNQR